MTWTKDRFDLLLPGAVGVILVFTLLSVGGWHSLVLSLTLGLGVIGSLRVAHLKGRWVPWVEGMVALSVALAVLDWAFRPPGLRQLISTIWTLGFGSSVAAVILRVLKHSLVTFQTVLGAICAYVLLGATFAIGFATWQLWSATPFFVGRPQGSPSDFTYFSFVTLCTVGYGDFVPASALGRFGAILEALIGQVFLVTLVARLVSLYERKP